jgi:hypothetical protein
MRAQCSFLNRRQVIRSPTSSSRQATRQGKASSTCPLHVGLHGGGFADVVVNAAPERPEVLLHLVLGVLKDLCKHASP